MHELYMHTYMHAHMQQEQHADGHFVRAPQNLERCACRVRVGVRSTDKAQAYLDTAMAYGLLPKGSERRVQIVEYDVTQPDTISAAIGSASKVHTLLRTSISRRYEQKCGLHVGLQQQHCRWICVRHSRRAVTRASLPACCHEGDLQDLLAALCRWSVPLARRKP